jgi:hypothetical protein
MPAIQIAHSIVAGHQPILQLPGQIGINEADGLLYARDASGNATPLYFGAPGAIYGLVTSNNGGAPTTSIDIAAGVASADASPYTMINLASTLTKNVAVNWVVGNNQGGLDTGAVGNGTYHLFLIRRPDTGVVDALFSLSPTSPSMPANYTQRRRIGSIGRTGGANIAYTQYGNEFLVKNPPLDVNAVTVPSGDTTVTLSVPTGIHVWAIFNFRLDSTPGNSNTMAAYALDIGVQSGNAWWSGGGLDVTFNTQGGSLLVQTRTNTSAQIGVVGSPGASPGKYTIATFGWLDARGQYGAP